jgi:glycosyltransferase involved in cell wall biosynthesis
MAARTEELPIPQRCTLVLPSSGAFDSRAWRIASTLSSRGHNVTVMARLEPGVAANETHPAGYRIIRVPVSAMAGLPGPLRWVVQRLRGRSTPPTERAAEATTPTATGGSSRGSGRGGGGRLVGPLRSAWSAGVRLAAIALTVRSQRIATRAAAPPADIVHAMAYMGIPVGLDLGRRDAAPVVYDARDIYVDAANIARLPGPARRLFAQVERRWARRASRVATVNDPYADVMERRFGVPRPLIVMNCSYRRDEPAVRQRLFHERLGLDRDTRVVLYQGGFSRDRGIEQLIEAVPLFPDRTVLVLLGYGLLQAELERRATEPGLADRLFVLPAVAPTELLDWVGSADVVAMPIQPSTLNHRLTTPNKLFEAMAVGVPVVASDLPGMAAIVRETGCGVLCDPTSPAAIATAIRSILDAPEPERLAYRERSLAAAHGRYSWEAQAETLIAEFGRLTGRPW